MFISDNVDNVYNVDNVDIVDNVDDVDDVCLFVDFYFSLIYNL